MKRTSRARVGVALLEALVALTILTIAALSLVAFANESERAVERVRIREQEFRRANNFLNAIALWPREDLDRHLGNRPEGRWHLEILRPHHTLYTIVLFDSTGARELLRTALYRPDSSSGR